jgi:muconolactone delta-isomerase
MRFLALATSDDGAFADLTPEAAADLAEAESRRTWELVQAGAIRTIDFRTDRRDVVLTLEVDDEAEASAVLASLPMAQARLISFEVIGLRPYDGWGGLFASDAERGG